MMLGMLRKNADKMIVPQTDLLEKCIAECIEKSRNLSYSINPPVLNRKGLLAALEDLPREMENKHGLKVELRTRRGTEPESPALASILYRAARELLLNVVKHSGVNSATLDVHLDNEMIFIRLQDAGNGFHYDAVRSRQGRGSGFGLYNIEDRVTFMGGSMKIQTAPNKGCAVELTVPKCFSPKTARPLVQARDVPLGQAVKAEPSSSDPIRVSGQEDKIRILIADDHHLIRQALAKMLQVGNKMKVVGQAVDGGEAVRLATQLQPDVVLMDVNMPELNGFEATSRIKREFPHIGIIGLSMHNNGSARQKMLNAGAAAYLTKTESPETLIETILQVHQSSG
jgi:CheY-like chemotaxis protein